ncbi:MAG: nitroreductase family protein [Sporolactobacillus sp.]
MNQTIETMNAHRSIRHFKKETLTDQQKDIIIHAAQMAPSSSNIQPYSIIGLTDPERKKQLAVKSENPAIAESGYCFIFCLDLHRLLSGATEEEQKKIAKNLSFHFFYQAAVISASLALQNASLAAESLGLGSVIMAGINRTIPELEQWLELPQLVIPLVGLAVGVPAEDPGRKPRLPQAAVFFEDRYQDASKQIEEYDQEIEVYYAKRLGDSRKISWTEKNKKILTLDLPLEFYTQYVHSKGLGLH